MHWFRFSLFTFLTAVIPGLQAISVPTTWSDLNEPATLNCTQPCTGVETWELSGRKVAECGRKEGLELSCERHGDQSVLTVPHVNYITRGFYYTRCNEQVTCFQNLQPKTHRSSVDVAVGGFLILDLFTLQPVTLTFTCSARGRKTSVQMCSVDGRSVQCDGQYGNRVSMLDNSVVLRNISSADGGEYVVREIQKGGALIRTVSVTVTAPEFTVKLDAGKDLKLDLQILKPVTIEFTRPGNSSAVQMCSVDGDRVQCLPEYQQRVRVINNFLILMNMMPSDSGNYTIREKDTTLISISHVTVNDVLQSQIWKDGYEKGNNAGYDNGDNTGCQRGFKIGSLVFGFLLFVVGVIVGPYVCSLTCRSVHKLKRGQSSKRNQTEDVEKVSFMMEKTPISPGAIELQEEQSWL